MYSNEIFASNEPLHMKNIGMWRAGKLAPLMCLNIVDENVWLAGGALRTLIHTKEEVSDFDIFFKFEHDIEPVKEKLKQSGFEETFACPAKELFTYKKDDVKIQLITKFFYNNMRQLIQTFDFTCAMWATDGETVVTTPAAVRDTRTRTIKLYRVTFPVATVNRMLRYQRKHDYRVHPDAMIDFVKMVNVMSFNKDSLQLYID